MQTWSGQPANDSLVMPTLATVNINVFFYLIDNTLALCLSQDLPCKKGADILLIRCGDVRNILFTTWLRGESNYY